MFDIKLCYCHNSPGIREFVTEKNIKEEFSEIGEVEEKDLHMAAGENDYLHIILSPVELAMALGVANLVKDGIKEFIKLYVKDVYETHKKSHLSIKGSVLSLLDKILWITGISKMPVLLGVRTPPMIERRNYEQNIAFNLKGLSNDEIEKRLLILAVYGDTIKKFVADLLTKKGFVYISNYSDAVLLELDGYYPFLEYSFVEETQDGIQMSTHSKTTFSKKRLELV